AGLHAALPRSCPHTLRFGGQANAGRAGGALQAMKPIGFARQAAAAEQTAEHLPFLTRGIKVSWRRSHIMLLRGIRI
ncbi:MAG: hypothetical protein LAT81_06895, partial [Oceanicaulis sp.]|nr:hypothetical protein [Oceanicaulis sp.]